MKKIVSFLLIALLALSFSLSTFATEEPEDGGEDTQTSTVNATVVIPVPLQEKKLMGNVNLDDGLTAADAASILRLLVHLENWEDAGRNFALGDCNFSNTREDAYGNWVIGHEVDGVWTASDDPADRNNAVTAADASAILRFLVHLENTWYYNDHSYYMLNGVVMDALPSSLYSLICWAFNK
ncbi:MAG: hypothetical protein PHT58_07070 [Eubacteriales bacterium]|nr:hypothetical protein [Eubacteriales bacterium]